MTTYINFSGDYEKFDEWKNKTKSIVSHKGIMKYLTKKLLITTEEDAETYEYKLNINERKSEAWGSL